MHCDLTCGPRSDYIIPVMPIKVSVKAIVQSDMYVLVIKGFPRDVVVDLVCW